MSIEHKAGLSESALSGDSIIDYLLGHPEFFEAHPDLLIKLKVPHPSGTAVSLIERQVEVLRGQNRQMERKLVDLIEVARANDTLIERIHRLALALLEGANLPDRLYALQEELRERFGADEVSLFLLHPDAKKADAGPARWLTPDDPGLDQFRDIMKSGKSHVGRLRPPQLEFLFGEQAEHIASSALVTLGDKGNLGLLAVGSRDAERFSPTLGTAFLTRISELVTAAVHPLIPEMNETLQNWIQRFIDHLAQRNLSPHTRENYGRDLAALKAWCEKQKLADWSALDVHHIRNFISTRHRQGLSPKSLQRVLASIRSFYVFLQGEGVAKKNPAEGVRAPKAAKRLPDTLDADQMARLLQIPGDDAETVRDRAIMELLYSSGLRLAEMISVRLTDLDLGQGLITVTGKGNKTRIVPVGREASKALKEWLKARGELAKPDDTTLFVSVRGGRLSPRSVQARLKHWGRVQGVQQGVYPHLFRHSFASHVLESSGDLRAVQELLGHANISTTQIYTHLDFQHLAKTYDAAHPRAKRKSSGK